MQVTNFFIDYYFKHIPTIYIKIYGTFQEYVHYFEATPPQDTLLSHNGVAMELPGHRGLVYVPSLFHG